MFQKSFNSLNAANLVNREILETLNLFVLKKVSFASFFMFCLFEIYFCFIPLKRMQIPILHPEKKPYKSQCFGFWCP